MTDDERKWRNRLLIMTLVRLSGIAIISAGLLIAFSDLLVPGGSRLIGALVIVAGTIDAAFAPVLLQRAWNRQP